MDILVAYYSETGNTRKLAEAIFAGITHSRKELLSIGEVKDPAKYDIIFCGFPVINHGIPAKMTKFLNSIPKGKTLAFFATHGSLRGGEKAITAFYAALSLAHGQTILGTFGCRGQVSSKLLDSLMQHPEHKAWAIEANSANGHPTASDLADARAFADLMLHTAKHSHGKGSK